uniref:Argininosuccinate lyase n=1 Tax=Lygus hesperus TaxID=30085 RepID=A0A0A9ZHH4_LYGHE
MTIPCIFQVYALDNDATSPMAGAAIIALIYNPTGSESFHYASGRLQGTVLGSMAALMGVQVAHQRRGVLYIFIALISFVGAYVQAAPNFYAFGNAIVCSTISIMVQYKN